MQYMLLIVPISFIIISFNLLYTPSHNMELTMHGMQGLKPTKISKPNNKCLISVKSFQLQEKKTLQINQQSLLNFLAQMPGGIVRSFIIINGFELGLIYFLKKYV